MKRIYVLLIIAVFTSIKLSATTYTSAQNGSWMSVTTWSPFGIPVPGDIIVINHNVVLDTSFAYTLGSITVNNAGSLVQDSPVRDIWVNGPNASLTNNGTTTIRYLLLSAGSYTNSGNFNVNSISNYITANNTSTGVIMGVDSMYNDGIINNNGDFFIKSFYNNNTINNYGTIQGTYLISPNLVDSMVNAGTFLNDAGALLQADSCTNFGGFTNSGVVNFNQFTNVGTLTNTNTLTFDDITNFGTFTNSGTLTGANSMWNVEIFDNTSTGQITLANGFLNADSIGTASFNNDGTFDIGDSFYNFNDITGTNSGSFTVQDTSYTSGTMSGSFDFCDATPPVTFPYIDIILGTVDPAITYCTVGINTNEILPYNLIYPNPTNGIVNIDTDANVSVVVYNVLGEKVISTKNHKIDLSSFESGVYFVLLKDEKGKIIKQEKIMKH